MGFLETVFVNLFKEHLDDNEFIYYFIKDYLYPKQAIQLIGQERYNNIMGETWR